MQLEKLLRIRTRTLRANLLQPLKDIEAINACLDCLSSIAVDTLQVFAPLMKLLGATEERYKIKGAYIILESPNFDNQKFLTFEVVTPRSKVLIVRQDMKMKSRKIAS
uniref:Uncharacterized protein n=1 Tax=Quercus lobata TaxID=97700 RepID=A0A7N2MW74_QUELO